MKNIAVLLNLIVVLVFIWTIKYIKLKVIIVTNNNNNREPTMKIKVK